MLLPVFKLFRCVPSGRPAPDPDSEAKGPGPARRKRQAADSSSSATMAPIKDEKYSADDVKIVSPSPFFMDDTLKNSFIVNEPDEGKVTLQMAIIIKSSQVKLYFPQITTKRDNNMQ